MQFHPVANLFPLTEGAEFEALKADIQANGLLEPIWTYQGQILDGRNRYRACKAIGVEPRFREWKGKGSPAAFVVSLNLHRRHLDASQRAMLAADLEPLLAAEAKGRQKEGGKKAGRGRPQQVVEIVPQPNDKARDQAATLTGTNGRYVQDAKKVIAQAPELAEKVRAGEMTLPQAKREVQKAEKHAQLEDKAMSVPKRDLSWQILCGKCDVELTKLDHGSVSLIFADPPYNIGVDYGDGTKADRLDPMAYLGWCQHWMSLCYSLLTPTGSFWVMINDEYACDFHGSLRAIGFHHRAWIKWYETFGVCNSAGTNFSRTSRHLFYCVKDPKKFTFNLDAVSRPSDRQSKYNDSRANPSGKVWDDVWVIPRLVGISKERIPDFPTQLPLELLMAVVGCSSDPGDLVLDPFSGSATTGVACLRLGRRYVGIEAQKKFVDLSTLRLKGER